MKKVLFSRFTGSVKLKGIIISGEDDETHPAEIRLQVDPLLNVLIHLSYTNLKCILSKDYNNSIGILLLLFLFYNNELQIKMFILA